MGPGGYSIIVIKNEKNKDGEGNAIVHIGMATGFDLVIKVIHLIMSATFPLIFNLRCFSCAL